MKNTELSPFLALCLFPLGLTALALDNTIDVTSTTLSKRAGEIGGQVYTCDTAFSYNGCGVILTNRNCQNICSCNPQAQPGCQAYAQCSGSEVLDLCAAKGDCGCVPD